MAKAMGGRDSETAKPGTAQGGIGESPEGHTADCEIALADSVG